MPDKVLSSGRARPQQCLTIRSITLAAGIAGIVACPSVSADSISFAGAEVCPADVIPTPTQLLPFVGSDPSTQSIELEADQIDAPDANTLVLSGGAHVIQGAQAVYADQIAYNKETYSVRADGNITLHSASGDRLQADMLELELETRIGEAQNARVQLAQRGVIAKRRLFDSRTTGTTAYDSSGLSPVTELEAEPTPDQGAVRPVRAVGRGEAERIFFEGHDRERLENVWLTSCREGQDSVILSAKEVVLDHSTGIGTGKNMTLRFFKVPIFYFPQASFPITDERKTGFLFPSIGTDDKSGFIFELPFYWNVAPDKDATIVPRYMVNRGLQVMGELRYLGESYNGVIRAEVLPDDDLYGDDRYGFSYDHRQRFSPEWDGDIDLNYISDVDYLDDFATDLNVSSATHLPQRGTLRYRGDNLNFDAAVEDYQTIDDRISKEGEPYARLPRLALNGDWSGYGGVVEYGFDSELVNFDHPSDIRTTGGRFNVIPYVTLPFEEIYGFVTPKLSFDFASYSLDNQPADDPDNPDRAVPIFSVDSGLFFERPVTWGGRSHTQTLEPRLFYVYIPDEFQDDIPVFDTGPINFDNISNYYRENRFYGRDRVGDTNRLTLGLESRTFDVDSGEQRFRAALAQIIYFSDRNVSLIAGDDTLDDDESDLLGEIDAALARNWNSALSLRWDWELSNIESARVSARYDPGPRKDFEIGYWFDREFQEQVDLRFNWPLAPRWQVEFQDIYSLEDSENLAASLSLGYDACCWAVKVTGETRRRRNEEDETSVFLSLEFKNLGQISSGF